MNGKEEIELYITGCCNSDCDVCYDKWYFKPNSEREDRIYVDLKRIREITSDIEGKVIIIRGGEPTTHPGLPEIIERIRQTKNIPVIFTNGLRLADRSYLNKLKGCGLKSVVLSFDGFKPEIYRELRGGKEDYYKKIKALKNLEAEEIWTEIIFTVVKKYNMDQIQNMMSLISQKEFITSLKFLILFLEGTNPEIDLTNENVPKKEEIVNKILSSSNLKRQKIVKNGLTRENKITLERDNNKLMPAKISKNPLNFLLNLFSELNKPGLLNFMGKISSQNPTKTESLISNNGCEVKISELPLEKINKQEIL